MRCEVGLSHYDRHAGFQTPFDVPACLAPASPGEYFDAHFDAEEDAIVFRRLPEKGKEDWLAVLRQCPVRMDDIPSRRRERARRRKL